MGRKRIIVYVLSSSFLQRIEGGGAKSEKY